MVIDNLTVSSSAIAEFCRQHHIRRLSFFGSVLREEFSADSDVDVLVEFAPGHTPGFSLIQMQDTLSTLLGDRRVDLVTEKFLHPHIREKVLATAEVLYRE